MEMNLQSRRETLLIYLMIKTAVVREQESLNREAAPELFMNSLALGQKNKPKPKQQTLSLFAL